MIVAVCTQHGSFPSSVSSRHQAEGSLSCTAVRDALCHGFVKPALVLDPKNRSTALVSFLNELHRLVLAGLPGRLVVQAVLNQKTENLGRGRNSAKGVEDGLQLWNKLGITKLCVSG